MIRTDQCELVTGFGQRLQRFHDALLIPANAHRQKHPTGTTLVSYGYMAASQDPLGIMLGAVWDHFGMILIITISFGIIVALSWDHLGIIFETIFWMIQEWW